MHVREEPVAAAFPTSWDTVYRAVRMAVDWGLAHRDLTNIEAMASTSSRVAAGNAT